MQRMKFYIFATIQIPSASLNAFTKWTMSAEIFQPHAEAFKMFGIKMKNGDKGMNVHLISNRG